MHSSYTNHSQKKHCREKFCTFRTAVFAALLVGLSACGSEPLAGDTTLAGLEIAAPVPNELIFSSVKGSASPAQTITLENIGSQPLELHQLSLSGTDAAAFRLSAPDLPLAIPPGGNAEVAVAFAPHVSGPQSASLQIRSSDPDDGLVSIALYGLGSHGEQGVLEPPLHAIVQTLGYDVDVGGQALRLGTGARAIGDEVLAPLFEQAGAAPVTLTVVARYGPEEVFPYGFFLPTEAGAATSLREVGRIAAENAQELLPPLAAGSATFDPGDQPFGIYGQAGGETQYSLDALNHGQVAHALRVYPLRDRSGNPVPNSYLIGLEEAKNGDYQDALFVLRNVRAAPATVPEARAAND